MSDSGSKGTTAASVSRAGGAWGNLLHAQLIFAAACAEYTRLCGRTAGRCGNFLSLATVDPRFTYYGPQKRIAVANGQFAAARV